MGLGRLQELVMDREAWVVKSQTWLSDWTELNWVHHVKCQAGWITNWNQDCWEILTSSDCRWNHSNGWKWRIKEPLDEGERREWKIWLKTQYSKNEDHVIWSHHFMQIDGETMETVRDFIFLGSKICGWWLKPWKLKDACSLEEKLWPT